MNEIDLRPLIEEIARQVVREELVKLEAQRLADAFGVPWTYVSEPSPEVMSLPPGTSILPNDKS